MVEDKKKDKDKDSFVLVNVPTQFQVMFKEDGKEPITERELLLQIANDIKIIRKHLE